MASLLDSARIGSLTSLSVTCGAIESILLKAERDANNTKSEASSSSYPTASSSNGVATQGILDPAQQTDLSFLNGSLSNPQDHETTSAETMTNSSISVLNRIATVAQLFTAASFHLASSSLQTASSIAQDTLHIMDAIFGSTDSSRALAAIITLVRREFGDGSGLYSLVTGLTCFTLLQSRGWGRTVDEIEMFIVWDVVVLDTGETLSQQFPTTDDYERKKESEEESIISAIPNNSQYRIAINEIKTKTYSIDVLSDSPISSVKLPKSAVIIHKEYIPAQRPNEKAKYTITFQTTSKYYRERKGTLNKDNTHQVSHQIASAAEFIIDPTSVSIQNRDSSPELPDNYDDEPPSCINDRRYSFNNPIILENLLVDQSDSDNSTDSENKEISNNETFSDEDDDDLHSSSRSSICNDKFEKPTKVKGPDLSQNECSDTHSFNKIDSSTKTSSHSFSPGNINRRSLTQLSSLARSPSASSLKRSTGSVSDFDKLGKLCNTCPPSSNSLSSISHRSSSKCNLVNVANGNENNNSPSSDTKTKSLPTSFSVDDSLVGLNRADATTADSPGAGGVTSPAHVLLTVNNANNSNTVSKTTQQIVTKKFPPGHITQNMAKYMRFATASYGQSFMSVLGVGKYYSPYGGYNGGTSPHSEHYAFANHTGLDLNDILLSSYSDSAIDDKAGIPLVHFVSIDHKAKAVVLTIRGTLGIEDILTDLTCDYEIMEWSNDKWKAHGGMLRCAQILKRRTSRVLSTIRQALESMGEEYGLVICGHSLGGGVGAILGILLSEIRSDGVFVTSHKQAQAHSFALPANRRIHCFAYGPPASISEELRVKTRGLITSVIYGLDIVPCLSLGVLRDFQNVALAFKNDQEGIAADIRKRFIAQFASRHIPLSVHDSDDDYLWELLTKLRGVMHSEKLVPPGEVYHVSTNTVFETHDGKTKRATRIIGKVIVDVEKRFGEPVFGRGIFHHSPLYYERATRTLEMGVCNAPV